jgi:hypothetical protein
MTVVTLESGSGEGHTGRVASDGSVHTRITHTVDAQLPSGGVNQGFASITTTAATLVAGRSSGRRQHITLQNRDSTNSVVIGLTGTDPNANDLQLTPGMVLSIPNSDNSEIRAKSDAGTVLVTYVELYSS